MVIGHMPRVVAAGTDPIPSERRYEDLPGDPQSPDEWPQNVKISANFFFKNLQQHGVGNKDFPRKTHHHTENRRPALYR
jgi:hypothetical protein